MRILKILKGLCLLVMLILVAVGVLLGCLPFSKS